LLVLKQSVLAELSEKRPGFVGITMVPSELELEGGGFGVQIRMVSPDSPAQTAGLRPNDVVTELDGIGWDGLDAADSFAARVGNMSPGTRVTLGVLRNGESLDVEVILGARPWAAGDYGDQRRFFMQQGGLLQQGGGLVFPPANEEAAREEAFQKWLESKDAESIPSVD
jgi:membrane-associated protease RseP (regulator of RpoE activity)